LLKFKIILANKVLICFLL